MKLSTATTVLILAVMCHGFPRPRIPFRLKSARFPFARPPFMGANGPLHHQQAPHHMMMPSASNPFQFQVPRPQPPSPFAPAQAPGAHHHHVPPPSHAAIHHPHPVTGGPGNPMSFHHGSMHHSGPHMGHMPHMLGSAPHHSMQPSYPPFTKGSIGMDLLNPSPLNPFFPQESQPPPSFHGKPPIYESKDMDPGFYMNENGIPPFGLEPTMPDGSPLDFTSDDTPPHLNFMGPHSPPPQMPPQMPSHMPGQIPPPPPPPKLQKPGQQPVKVIYKPYVKYVKVPVQVPVKIKSPYPVKVPVPVEVPVPVPLVQKEKVMVPIAVPIGPISPLMLQNNDGQQQQNQQQQSQGQDEMRPIEHHMNHMERPLRPQPQQEGYTTGDYKPLTQLNPSNQDPYGALITTTTNEQIPIHGGDQQQHQQMIQVAAPIGSTEISLGGPGNYGPQQQQSQPRQQPSPPQQTFEIINYNQGQGSQQQQNAGSQGPGPNYMQQQLNNNGPQQQNYQNNNNNQLNQNYGPQPQNMMTPPPQINEIRMNGPGPMNHHNGPQPNMNGPNMMMQGPPPPAQPPMNGPGPMNGQSMYMPPPSQMNGPGPMNGPPNFMPPINNQGPNYQPTQNNVQSNFMPPMNHNPHYNQNENNSPMVNFIAGPGPIRGDGPTNYHPSPNSQSNFVPPSINSPNYSQGNWNPIAPSSSHMAERREDHQLSSSDSYDSYIEENDNEPTSIHEPELIMERSGPVSVETQYVTGKLVPLPNTLQKSS